MYLNKKNVIKYSFNILTFRTTGITTYKTVTNTPITANYVLFFESFLLRFANSTLYSSQKFHKYCLQRNEQQYRKRRETGLSAFVKRRKLETSATSRLFYATEYSCMQFSWPEGTIFASKRDKRCALSSKRKQKEFHRARKGRQNSHYEQVSPGERFKNTIILFALRLE